MSFKSSLILGLICLFSSIMGTPLQHEPVPEATAESSPAECDPTISNSTSKVMLYGKANHDGESAFFQLADNQTCVDLSTYNKSNWAYSINTHCTCIIAWLRNDCTGPHIMHTAVDNASHQDLSANRIADLPEKNWALKIGSLSNCNYGNLVSTEFPIESTSETSTEPSLTICEVMHPNSNSTSQITLYEQVNYCGKSFHFEIADNHTCVDLRAKDRADWAKSISTHDTCVTVWYKYDCTGPRMMHKAVDNSSSPQDLSSNQIADLPEKKTWALNIGSLSSCNYGNLVSTESPLEQTSETPTEPNSTSCEVIHPNSNSTSQITLYEQINFCGESSHFEIADNHTCVDLRAKDRADWAKSISTHGTCVTVWYKYDCTGPRMMHKAVNSSSSHQDLSSNQIGDLPEKSWTLNIASISSCDYQKFSVQPTPRNSSNNPNLNLQIYFSLFNFNEFFTNSSFKKLF